MTRDDDAVELPKDQPVGQLGPQPWLEAAATQAVVAALTADGGEVRFVGGCVRDSVLHRPVHDIDIATHDPPERVMMLLERAAIRAIPTGIDHGTVTAVIGQAHFEITTLRRDVETFGRRARVEFTNDWAADAARRDFTMNALFCRPDGMIFDPFDGLPDIGAGRIRFVGDPVRRIDEDALRLLRFFRFYAHYGKPPPDADALNACRMQAGKLATLSGERISGELFKLLQAPEPTAVLLLMQGERVLQHVLPEARDFGRLRVLTFLETRGILRPHLGADPLRRLAALLPADRSAVETVAGRLRLSSAQTERLLAIAVPAERPDIAGGMRGARRMLYRVGPDRFRDLVLLAWAERRSVENRPPAAESERWIALLDAADGWQSPRLPVGGHDVLALGVEHGVAVGVVLGKVEQWWMDADFEPGREEALAYLKTLVGGSP